MPSDNDYDYLYQVGENSYATPWNMRSLFGLPEQPRALTSQEEVNVTAPMPGPNEPYPRNMASIYLGTNQVPPTGTYTPPRTSNPTVDKELQPAWNEFTQRYPFANNFVSNVRSQRLPGVTRGMQVGGTTFVDDSKLEPSMIAGTLAHETAHATQNQQYPNTLPNAQRHMGGIFTPYRERPGEATAFKTQENDTYLRFLDKANAENAEYHAQAEADYRAGKRPKPYWMD
jgi:hypothetical protein